MGKKTLVSMVLVVAVVLGFLFFNSGDRSRGSGSMMSESGYKSVSADEFSSLIKNGDGFLLDVHIPEQTHIPGTDAFIAYNEISENQDKLPEDKETPILVYCRSGSMSREAAIEIAGLGYKYVYDLSGGINEFRESNSEVVITPDTSDLGTVIYGDVARTNFTLTNFTPAPLIIIRVSTSCGCTKAEVTKDKLDAYEATTVKVSFDPAVHKDDTDLGDITRTIFVETDNPKFPKVTSEITAHVVKEN